MTPDDHQPTTFGQSVIHGFESGLRIDFTLPMKPNDSVIVRLATGLIVYERPHTVMQKATLLLAAFGARVRCGQPCSFFEQVYEVASLRLVLVFAKILAISGNAPTQKINQNVFNELIAFLDRQEIADFAKKYEVERGVFAEAERLRGPLAARLRAYGLEN
jgi:hypothetical protein